MVQGAIAVKLRNTIQPREHSIGGGIEGILHISDENLNLLSTNTDNYCLNAYNGNPENSWNQQNGFAFLEQFPLFLPSLVRGVFYELPLPTT